MGNFISELVKGVKNFTGLGLTLTWPEKLLIFFSPFLLPLATQKIDNFYLDVLVRVLILNFVTIALLKLRCKEKLPLTESKTYLARGTTYLLIIWYIALMVMSYFTSAPYVAIVYNLLTSFLGSIILGFLLVSSYRVDAGATCG